MLVKMGYAKLTQEILIEILKFSFLNKNRLLVSDDLAHYQKLPEIG
jgi:hypothetical protein